jgi:hypothetical protein
VTHAGFNYPGWRWERHQPHRMQPCSTPYMKERGRARAGEWERERFKFSKKNETQQNPLLHKIVPCLSFSWQSHPDNVEDDDDYLYVWLLQFHQSSRTYHIYWWLVYIDLMNTESIDKIHNSQYDCNILFLIHNKHHQHSKYNPGVKQKPWLFKINIVFYFLPRKNFEPFSHQGHAIKK